MGTQRKIWKEFTIFLSSFLVRHIYDDYFISLLMIIEQYGVPTITTSK